uniref:Uncharacterized protein n=1 Tax=Arundo donax TaxID=35708 RepID=A0A0A9CNH4_ARUDO
MSFHRLSVGVNYNSCPPYLKCSILCNRNKQPQCRKPGYRCDRLGTSLCNANHTWSLS